ncbi:hypothetical protein [Metapseudomonas furukawaii]
MGNSTLFIERLVVSKSGGSVYDERFHRGINVIRGDHSVGKTTILELLFYVLGGEIKENQWLYPADKCDCVICQLSINGKTFTIKRDIEKGKVPPISIRSGALESDGAEFEAWGSYGSRRGEERMSFSQKFFELLGWEGHKTEDYANLTMHQILRFLYVDQETASTKIFRAEDNPRADSEGTRLAIAEFLLGLDNLDTHQMRQELLIAEREFERVSSDLLAMYRILGEDSSVTLQSLQQSIANNVGEIVKLREAPPDADASSDVKAFRDVAYKKIRSDVELFNKQLQRFHEDLLSVSGEIVDCELFDRSLKQRRKALLDSRVAHDSIGFLRYSQCPCCLNAIKEAEKPSSEEVCHLCKSPVAQVEQVSNYMELLNELDFQINSNSRVLQDLLEHKLGIEAAISVASMNLANAQSKLSEMAGLFDLASHSALERAKRIGFLESENSNYEKKIRIVTDLDNHKLKKLDLNADIARLKELLLAANAANKSRRNSVYAGLAENVVSILRSERRVNGNPYEEEFSEATISGVEIDFAKDRMLINGRVKFSGSSNYVKKNSLPLSALLESLDDENYRLPRFLMVDAIENGGMKEFRSHNFQRALIKLFEGRKDFQLIFCTSMVLDELDNADYGVGPFYQGNVLQI